MFKKGFSMIELLFVMVILAALTAIAIPNISGGERAAAITSMHSDMKNIINLVNRQFIETQSYGKITKVNGSPVLVGGDSINGFAEYPFIDGTKIPLSKDNRVWIDTHSLDEGYYCNGYEIRIYNKLIDNENLVLEFDSCNMSAPKLSPMLG